MKKLFENRKLGFWLSAGAAVVGLIASILYLVLYAMTAHPVTGEWDRVFKWVVFCLMLGGSLISLAGEASRLGITPIISGVAYALALAMHLVETAYPLADVLTKVPFFGGDPKLAIFFSVLFGIVAIIHVVASFTEHNKK